MKQLKQLSGIMYNCHCKSWAVTAIYFRRLPPIIANDKLMTILFGTINE